jgi:2-polyprenyl-3-methyl-5-hydroxy-6-metoxy-1,4-benzoquinol methylase
LLNKDQNYYHGIRWDIINFVSKGNNRILDIGCGDGNTGKALKDQGKAAEVVGIEKVSEIAQIAETKIDKVICANVETVELPFNEGYFDYIIMGDVLEHLYDPWTLVNNMGPYLKRGGYILASVPNIRNWSIIKGLVLKGEWNYSSEGLLDDTHLRFFTKKSILKLFSSKDFLVHRIIPRFGFQSTYKNNIAKILTNFTLGLLEGFLALQYIVIARKL